MDIIREAASCPPDLAGESWLLSTPLRRTLRLAELEDGAVRPRTPHLQRQSGGPPPPPLNEGRRRKLACAVKVLRNPPLPDCRHTAVDPCPWILGGGTSLHKRGSAPPTTATTDQLNSNGP